MRFTKPKSGLIVYLRALKTFGATLVLGIFISACASLSAIGGTTWKEEVLLHDGNKIIVNRSQSYGGQHEIGQTPPIKEQDITFSVPGSSEKITWKSEFAEDIGRSNFKLVALHILDGTSYIVAVPNLCLSYNKWGRPNPPYVLFKRDGKLWQRIALAELPAEFKEINLVVNSKGEEKVITAQSIVTAELVKKLNGELEQPEYRSILREKIANAGGSQCGEMVGNGKGDWIGVGGFSRQPSLEACLRYCAQRNFSPQYCPCNTLFKGK
jgi:hypothetical protein